MIADRRATAWLRQALRDLSHARLSAEHGDPEWACFSAQQAAEKALKAVLIDLGHRVRRQSTISRSWRAMSSSTAA